MYISEGNKTKFKVKMIKDAIKCNIAAKLLNAQKIVIFLVHYLIFLTLIIFGVEDFVVFSWKITKKMQLSQYDYVYKIQIIFVQ